MLVTTLYLLFFVDNLIVVGDGGFEP